MTLCGNVSGKPPPSKVSSISLVRSAKKDARALEKKEENKPLAQVRSRRSVLLIVWYTCNVTVNVNRSTDYFRVVECSVFDVRMMRVSRRLLYVITRATILLCTRKKCHLEAVQFSSIPRPCGRNRTTSFE